MIIWTAESRLQRDQRRAFTLVELLVVIAIITLIASMTLFTLSGVREDARERRARTQVEKIHELLMQQWESYRTRAVPVATSTSGLSPVAAGQQRLLALRELMRLELPDRKMDLRAPAPELKSPPTAWRVYVRRASQQIMGKNGSNDVNLWMDNINGWTPAYEQAECLYLILASMRDGERTGLDFFSEDEIGDFDDDGMPEILDPWGMPIYFLRWAPGFVSDIQPGDLDTRTSDVDGDGNPDGDGNAGTGNGDPFDPLKRDLRWPWTDGVSRWNDGVVDNDPYVLFPLVVSGGRDKEIDLRFDLGLTYDPTAAAPNPYPYDDPYLVEPNNNWQLGDVVNGTGEADDNITNHLVEVR